MVDKMSLEKDILQTARVAISESIVKELVGYNKPLSKLISRVIEANEQEMYDLIDGEFSTLICGDDFKISLKKALNDKLAKVLVSRMGGELEKRINELKANPTTRAKITLAIEKCMDEIVDS